MVESDVNSEQSSAEADNSASEITEIEGRIIRQVEYYFGDFNLVKDKFLQEQIKEDDGWVPLTTLLKFNRLSSISTDSKEIVDALEKSTSGLLEIHESKEKIRRTPLLPLPEMNEERRKQLMERTIYCKGFPRESKLNDLLEFFHNFGEIDNVAMRCWNDKASNEWKFKCSVFVIFKTIEGAEKFIKLEHVKYNDEELIRKWQKDYIEEKRKERLEHCMKRGKKIKGQDKKKDENKGNDSKDDNGSGGGDEDEEKEDSDGFATGTVAELTGLDSSIKWENIKESIEDMGLPVAFIEYTPGQEVAFVRLTNKDSASELGKLVAKDDNKLKIGEKEMSVRVVEGEEEKTFLEKQKQALMKKKNAVKRKGINRKGRGGRGRNRGRWDNKKRRASSPAGEPLAKIKTRGGAKDE